MRGILFPGSIIVCAVLQSSFLGLFGLMGVSADLLLVCAVFASLECAAAPSLALALCAGILKDALSGAGFNAPLFCVWNLLIRGISRRISFDEDRMRAALVLTAALLHNVAVRIALGAAGVFIPFGICLRIIVISSLYTAAVSMPLMFLFDRMLARRRMLQREEWE